MATAIRPICDLALELPQTHVEPEEVVPVAKVVNLDAMILREDFNSEEGVAAGDRGKTEVSKTDLSKGESFYLTLRKPDFQRETAAWSPEAVCSFLESFVSGDLIPAVICWQSASRLNFVIDGAHRLSVVIAWLLDDYGAGDESKSFYANNIPPEQRKIDEETRKLINARVGSYKDIKAETAHPGSDSRYTSTARALANAKIQLQWVPGNDSRRAEKAFLTINQSAVEIEPTEFTILNSRNKPNAIAARAIVRNAGGHKYWKDFSESGGKRVEQYGREIYAALYHPPLQDPIRTYDLPIAGPGYGTQTLPLVFNLVNIANRIQVVDSSKDSKKSIVEQQPVDEGSTLDYLRETQHLANRIIGTHLSCLGLHPAVYFYSLTGRHQPTSVLAAAALIMDMAQDDEFIKFTGVRSRFEDFLLEHKMHVNQLTSQYGSMAKGFRPVRDYYRFVLECLWSEKSSLETEMALSQHEKYRRLVKEKPILSTQPKKFSRSVKQYAMITDALQSVKCAMLDSIPNLHT